MNTNNYDSDFCGNLPLHLINTIQPYGALLLFEKGTLKIIQASENVHLFLGVTAPEMLQKKLDVFLSAEEYSSFLEKINTPDKKIHQYFNLKFEGKQAENDVLCNLHVKDKYFVLELEFQQESNAGSIELFQKIQGSARAMQQAENLRELCAIAAREIRKVSAFDKIMIYHFDENWNGIVLGEDKEEAMDSYLGLRFPASDVPRQARELYSKNPYRFIPDRTYEPVKLHPVLNPLTFTYSDLSDCNLRGVAPVHLEYLSNMNVCASMSTAIIKNNKLWGLIASHNKTNKIADYTIRAAFELMSSIFATQIQAIESRELLTQKDKLEKISETLFSQVVSTRDLGTGLLYSAVTVLDLLEASGAVFYSNNSIKKTGEVPSKEVIDELVHWLLSNTIHEVFSKDSIVSMMHIRNEEDKKFAGMLAIPVNRDKEEYLIVFRNEALQTILWGGDPNNAIVKDEDEKNYHPRHSFSTWKETIVNKSLPWSDALLAAAESLRKSLQHLEGIKAF